MAREQQISVVAGDKIWRKKTFFIREEEEWGGEAHLSTVNQMPTTTIVSDVRDSDVSRPLPPSSPGIVWAFERGKGGVSTHKYQSIKIYHTHCTTSTSVTIGEGKSGVGGSSFLCFSTTLEPKIEPKTLFNAYEMKQAKIIKILLPVANP